MSTEVVNTNAPATPAVPPKEATPPVTPEVPSAAKPDDMSAKFAALAKKEKIARLNAQKVKEREAQLAERERVIAEREKLWEDEFRASPLEAIKKRGLTYEDMTKAALNDGKFDPATEVKSVKEEIQRLKDEQAQKEKKAAEERQTAAQKQEAEVIEAFQARISETIEAQKDKFELTHLYNAAPLVFQTVEEHFARTKAEGKPKVLSIEEACGLVEQYLESEIDRLATSSKKFQSKYAAAKAQAEGDKNKVPPKTSTTLTNNVATSAAPSLLSAASEADRMKRALAALG